ncbi:hypothetical protein [Streptomyces europaeiscabiei]|uniref:hypothetical protein n=1 Tax=Streptomyces europaeiscabiei TaxID=146819 RepID=UPI000765EAA3|nr:hypothetical protein [Streptomyces europaeiscabiei]MDX2767874.1 hypothetical protein [Streptomyces europaeiscabiei]MDX3665721.1 hypothetical protein [Streptomyces europaeiscabiei]MDX3713998.1 hypothetical protein [Streptomyces europaeiscabiei]MDX3861980.1 hypothetical protein [Streptomyces europaeiscabiei]MDX3873279.1 hypothetical protein [Streptomyces europaeiscabiei]
MIPPPTLTRYRTLIVEGHEGAGRNRLVAELAQLGFEVRHMPSALHHLDPALPYRELLAGPGRLAVDGNLIAELVQGPLRRGRSRVTWMQALDLADAVAERDGALLHLTTSEVTEAATAYARVFRTLAQHVAVVTLDVGEPGVPIRDPAIQSSQLSQNARQLTIG